jgi:hypothetical protein
MKWIEENMTLLYELILTFSNKKSLLSSKRIERFMVFTSMLALTWFFLVRAILNCTITSTDLMIVVSLWLGYAGFNTIQVKKDIAANKINDDKEHENNQS